MGLQHIRFGKNLLTQPLSCLVVSVMFLVVTPYGWASPAVTPTEASTQRATPTPTQQPTIKPRPGDCIRMLLSGSSLVKVRECFQKVLPYATSEEIDRIISGLDNCRRQYEVDHDRYKLARCASLVLGIDDPDSLLNVLKLIDDLNAGVLSPGWIALLEFLAQRYDKCSGHSSFKCREDVCELLWGLLAEAPPYSDLSKAILDLINSLKECVSGPPSY